MQPLTTGILAHVDAGKTTCIESMLFTAGVLKKAGRVDHQDAFLDFDERERSRKITIYSKQAGLPWKNRAIDVIDTPGHADFSAEMERTLSILDTAIVLVSALDGVQSHTRTIWKCLDAYQVPAILFVNKMDITTRTKDELLEDLRKNLSEHIVDLESDDAIEQFAALDEDLLEEFAQTGTLSRESMISAVQSRKAYPVLFGSALKNDNIAALLDALTIYSPPKEYPEEFGARVYKVTGDASNPLVHMKITGGKMHVRDSIGDQKVNQILIVHGQSQKAVQEAEAGQVVSVKGLDGLQAGDGLGIEKHSAAPLLCASLNYELILPDGVDPVSMMSGLRTLMMEDPSLQIEFNEASQAITIRLMGEIQKEILKKRIEEKTGVSVEFGTGKIVCLETITEPVFGYGHFEPLRHYAEVHLLLEPGRRGSGMTYSSRVPRDVLSLTVQRQILSALSDHTPRGILGGFALTDVHVILAAARVHQKHTLGGDLRQAADRALRQGLMKADSVLLEPFIHFEIETPSESLSRILFELESRQASVQVEEQNDGRMKVSGRGPLRLLMNFGSELPSLSKGRASVTIENDGYDVCSSPEEILEQRAYDPELDRRHPVGSVFCSNGAGHYVPWDEVEDHLHIPVVSDSSTVVSTSVNSGKVTQEELNRVFNMAGGSNSNTKKAASKPKRTELSLEPSNVKTFSSLPTVLIVDGYNMIYSWPSLAQARAHSLFAAREQLISMLTNYQGYKGLSLMVVFDGNHRKDNPGSTSRNGSASIIYTPSGMNADSWIEKKTADLKGKFRVIAATSDALIQNSVISHGAIRISARELERQVLSVNASAFKALKEIR